MKSESESTLLESEMESESRVPVLESLPTLPGSFLYRPIKQITRKAYKVILDESKSYTQCTCMYWAISESYKSKHVRSLSLRGLGYAHRKTSWREILYGKWVFTIIANWKRRLLMGITHPCKRQSFYVTINRDTRLHSTLGAFKFKP